jgi:hypothetical protein
MRSAVAQRVQAMAICETCSGYGTHLIDSELAFEYPDGGYITCKPCGGLGEVIDGATVAEVARELAAFEAEETEQRYTVDGNPEGTEFWIADEITGDISDEAYANESYALGLADKYNKLYESGRGITVLSNA